MSEITAAQLEQILRNAGRTADEFVAPVVKATAMKAKATQQQLVRKRSRKTERSIKATGPDGAPFGKRTIEAEIGPTWYVGRLLELGTSHSAPYPFIAGSLDPHMAEHQRQVGDAVMKGALRGLTS